MREDHLHKSYKLKDTEESRRPKEQSNLPKLVKESRG